MNVIDKAALEVQMTHRGEAMTVREALCEQLQKLWWQGDDFNRQRTFADWQYAVLESLAKAGFIASTVTTPEGNTGDEWPQAEFEAGQLYVAGLIDLIFSGGAA